ncbi:glycosyltransferase family 2 protein [Methylosinus sp. Sm6]|uniref:glycosyltransferase family 2 protein n=1 Tax=Methylosinus sp. Sm6 TaxID=2866948 RepID=UPI001C99462F|nr:glycosyltransferase family 2 protein [Methylosinus sp. Sm6]MBY6242472.1 glycosyltransferase family 2 protein [Methylosinus sp. Sm6]
MKLSIAMATFNGERNIGAQLESFLSQTRLPDELIVCDDGSSDETLPIVEAFAKRAPFPVMVYRNEANLGYTKNFETAARRCRGDIVFFSDQDDVWLPRKMEAVEAAFRADDSKLLFVHDGKIVDRDLRWRGATKLGQVKSGWGANMGLATGALSAMHRDLKSIAFPIPDEIVGHDWWIYAIARGLKVDGVIEEPLQLIRRHGENTSTWVASSVARINKMDVLVSQMRTEPASSYKDRLDYNNCLAERLTRVREASGCRFRAGVIDAALAELEVEMSALLRRSELVDAGFLAQKRIALEMLAQGKYRHFNGVRSFLRDIVRREWGRPSAPGGNAACLEKSH